MAVNEFQTLGAENGKTRDTNVKARKLPYYGHTTRKQGSCLEKEIMQGEMSCAHRRGKPCTAWMDVNTLTGLPRGRVNQNGRGQR